MLYANESMRNQTRGLGVAAGIVGGNGFSYLFLPDEGIGYHAAGIIVKSPSLTYLSLGIEPLKVLHKGNSTALYLVSGIGFKLLKETESEYRYISGKGYYAESSKTTNTLSFGAGLGGVYQSSGRLVANMEFLMAFWDERIIPMPQIGFYYMLW